ncbi:MAG: ribonuclease Z [Candidatus Odinarchaeia archaeon]
MKIIFLGTTGSIPTPERGAPAIAVKLNGEIILFDCGEGTQIQAAKAKVNMHKVTKIFLTHLHGDHVLGVPGLIMSQSLQSRKKPLHIFGPPGTVEMIKAIYQVIKFGATFDVIVHNVKEGLILENEKYSIYCVNADHGVESLSYALIEKDKPGKFYPEKAAALNVPKGELWGQLQRGCPVTLEDGRTVYPEEVMGPPRPGRKIVYSGDTRPCENVLKLSKNADVLIHDSTFDEELKENAIISGHSTSTEAAQLARDAGVKKLILFHISTRYRDITLLEKQARKIFPNTQAARDFMEIKVEASSI